MSQEKQKSEKEEYPTLEVTRVEIDLVAGREQTKAFARVVLNDQLKLTGLRIVKCAGGLLVWYPNDPSYKGEEFQSIFYPITQKLRERIEEIVLAKYNLLQEK